MSKSHNIDDETKSNQNIDDNSEQDRKMQTKSVPQYIYNPLCVVFASPPHKTDLINLYKLHFNITPVSNDGDTIDGQQFIGFMEKVKNAYNNNGQEYDGVLITVKLTKPISKSHGQYNLNFEGNTKLPLTQIHEFIEEFVDNETPRWIHFDYPSIDDEKNDDIPMNNDNDDESIVTDPGSLDIIAYNHCFVEIFGVKLISSIIDILKQDIVVYKSNLTKISQLICDHPLRSSINGKSIIIKSKTSQNQYIFAMGAHTHCRPSKALTELLQYLDPSFRDDSFAKKKAELLLKWVSYLNGDKQNISFIDAEKYTKHKGDAIIKGIRTFLRLNENNNDKNSSVLRIDGDQKIRQHDLLDVFVHGEQYEIIALQGQRGLRAKDNMAPYTVFGEVPGRKLIEDDIVGIYNGTNGSDILDCYGYFVPLSAQMPPDWFDFLVNGKDETEIPAKLKTFAKYIENDGDEIKEEPMADVKDDEV